MFGPASGYILVIRPGFNLQICKRSPVQSLYCQIATQVDQVVDVFYIRNFDGRKVDMPDRIEGIKSEIFQVLPDGGKEEKLYEEDRGDNQAV